MTQTFVTQSAGLSLPPSAKDWSRERANATMSRMLMFQFHVPHLGFHEGWHIIGVRDGENGPKFMDGFCRAVIQMARDHYDKKWPGTSREMVCTGCAVWNGTELERVTHMKDIQ
jgi:hypothetical protein